MAWRRPGDKPLSEAMMVRLLSHICVARPQWDKCITSSNQMRDNSYCFSLAHDTWGLIENCWKIIFFYLNCCILFQLSVISVPKALIHNKASPVQIRAWRVDNQLSEPRVALFNDHRDWKRIVSRMHNPWQNNTGQTTGQITSGYTHNSLITW